MCWLENLIVFPCSIVLTDIHKQYPPNLHESHSRHVTMATDADDIDYKGDMSNVQLLEEQGSSKLQIYNAIFETAKKKTLDLIGVLAVVATVFTLLQFTGHTGHFSTRTCITCGIHFCLTFIVLINL